MSRSLPGRFYEAKLDKAEHKVKLVKDVYVQRCDGVRVAVGVSSLDAPGSSPTFFSASLKPKALAYLPPHPPFRERESHDDDWLVLKCYDCRSRVEQVAEQDRCTGELGGIEEPHLGGGDP